jgi:hypothetical protein
MMLLLLFLCVIMIAGVFKGMSISCPYYHTECMDPKMKCFAIMGDRIREINNPKEGKKLPDGREVVLAIDPYHVMWECFHQSCSGPVSWVYQKMRGEYDVITWFCSQFNEYESFIVYIGGVATEIPPGDENYVLADNTHVSYMFVK